jgi:hypothetical protein
MFNSLVFLENRPSKVGILGTTDADDNRKVFPAFLFICDIGMSLTLLIRVCCGANICSSIDPSGFNEFKDNLLKRILIYYFSYVCKTSFGKSIIYFGIFLPNRN